LKDKIGVKILKFFLNVMVVTLIQILFQEQEFQFYLMELLVGWKYSPWFL
jgi:hypothetical protein